MGLFHKKHDVSDIYGIKKMNDSPFTRKGEKEAPESGRRHSDYYHKYFRGYTEVRQLNAKGRVVIERVYTQPWIVCGLSTGKYWLLRMLYAVLTIMSAVLFVTALTQKIPGNYSWIVAIPGYASAVLLILLAASILMYIIAEKKMTQWGHISSTKRLKAASFAVAIGQLLTAIALIIYAIITRIYVSESLICAAVILLSAICSGAMFLVERSVPYTEIPNETKLPAGDAYEIW